MGMVLQCTHLQAQHDMTAVAPAPTLTPTPLPEGEGLKPPRSLLEKRTQRRPDLRALRLGREFAENLLEARLLDARHDVLPAIGG